MSKFLKTFHVYVTGNWRQEAFIASSSLVGTTYCHPEVYSPQSSNKSMMALTYNTDRFATKWSLWGTFPKMSRASLTGMLLIESSNQNLLKYLDFECCMISPVLWISLIKDADSQLMDQVSHAWLQARCSKMIANCIHCGVYRNIQFSILTSHPMKQPFWKTLKCTYHQLRMWIQQSKIQTILKMDFLTFWKDMFFYRFSTKLIQKQMLPSSYSTWNLIVLNSRQEIFSPSEINA